VGGIADGLWVARPERRCQNSPSGNGNKAASEMSADAMGSFGRSVVSHKISITIISVVLMVRLFSILFAGSAN